MNQKEFERYIQDSLNNIDLNVDDQEVWNNIEHRVKRKKRRLFLLWIFLGLLGISSLFLLKDPSKDHKTLAEVYHEPTALAPNEVMSTETKKTAEINESTQNVDNKSFSSLPSKTKPSTAKETGLNETTVELIEMTEASSKLKLPKQVLAIPRINNLINVPNHGIGILEEVQGLRMVSHDKDQKKKKRRVPSKSKYHFSFEPYATVGIPWRIMNTKAFDDTYEQRRKNTEKQQESWTSGFQFGMYFNQKWFITAGLEYLRINERFSENYENIFTELQNVTAVIIEDTNGNIIETQSRMTNVEVTEKYRRLISNRHHYINTPIGIGLLQRNKHSSYSFAGGINLVLMHDFSGVIYNSDLSLIDLRKDHLEGLKSSIYKEKQSAFIWLSGNYRKQLSPFTEWSIMARLQVPTSSMTAEDYALQQRYILLQLGLGMHFRLE